MLSDLSADSQEGETSYKVRFFAIAQNDIYELIGYIYMKTDFREKKSNA